MDNERNIITALLAEAGIEIGGDRPWDVTVHDDRVFTRVVRERELGLGEAYQEGWWDAVEVDAFLERVLLADLRSQLRSTAVWSLALRSMAVNRQTRRRAHRNASAHYATGNDLFEAMLDKRMIYSCAYWAGANDLEAAQAAKLDLVCRKLHLEPGMKLLDIGCGWGGFAAYAAEHHGVEVTAISPVTEQVEVARQRCAGLAVTVLQADYRHVVGTFDRIVSIGMLEHVGPKNLRGFFDVCARLLTSDGLMLHHTIGSNETKQRTDPWFDRHVFPGGALPSLEQLGRATRRNWVIEDLHNFGPDYDRTLLAWRANIEARWTDLPTYDEHFRRTWRYYLGASAASFRVRDLQLWQLVMSRQNQVSRTYRRVA